MNSVKWLMRLGCLAACVCSATVFAEYSAVTELDLSGGWRRDNFRSNIVSGDASDTVKARCLDIWQIGFKGRWEPRFDFGDCWIDGLFARGYAYWGWVNDGDYAHRIKYSREDLEPPITSRADRDIGKIYGDRTQDYKIGVGYLFPINGCFRVGPVVGYSYDRLRFRASNVLGSSTTNNPNSEINQYCVSTFDPFACVDEGAHFTSKWRGAWLGVDARVQLCDIDINAGYEYHWSRWRGAFSLAGQDLTDCYHYSDRRKSNRSYGHEVFIDGHYIVNCFWTVGLGLEYKYYRQPHSNKFKPAHATLADVGCSADEVDTVRSNWRSFAITLDLGYLF